MSYQTQLVKKYKKIGLINNEGKHLSLHHSCICHNICWDSKKAFNDRYTGIIYSYVGENYPTTKLLVIAINNRLDPPPIHKYSEYDWISNAANDIRQTGNAWKLYKYVAIYATIWLTKSNRLKGTVTDNLNNWMTLADVLENQIAFAQAVKCNPKITNSNNPYSPMVNNCPSLILNEELNVLEPRGILVLGLPNFQRVQQLLTMEKGYNLMHFGGFTKKRPRLERWLCQKNNLKIIGVPHPSWGATVTTKLRYLNLPKI